MAITTVNWYAKNASRSHPFSMRAYMHDDKNMRIPNDLLVDAKIRFFSSDENAQLYTSYIEISATRISILFSENINKSAVCSFSASTADVVSGKMYAVTPIADGCTGYIVFGDTPRIAYNTHTFSDPQMSLICTSCTSVYLGNKYNRRWGIENGRIDGTYPLYIRSLGDVVFSLQNINLNGKDVLAIVGELRSDGYIVDIGGNNNNLLSEYAGVCGQRPESRTCEYPLPIESINGVKPDCCGRVFVEFRGCTRIVELENACGVVMVCPHDVANACPVNPRMPDENGMLPDDTGDTCGDASSAPVKSTQNTETVPWWKYVE
jgi:hypothetical protein